MATNKLPKHAHEFLRVINDAASDEEQVELIKKYAAQPPLNMILSLNFDDNIVLDLPPGMPPFNRDDATHPDLMAPLGPQIARLKQCMKHSPIPKMAKERVFIQIIEMIPPPDAEVLCAAKDKELTELFPKITKKNVFSAFPNYTGGKSE